MNPGLPEEPIKILAGRKDDYDIQKLSTSNSF
jgi:hypothetical protein